MTELNNKKIPMNKSGSYWLLESRPGKKLTINFEDHLLITMYFLHPRFFETWLRTSQLYLHFSILTPISHGLFFNQGFPWPRCNTK